MAETYDLAKAAVLAAAENVVFTTLLRPYIGICLCIEYVLKQCN